MRVALISDIHANAPALDAVLTAIAEVSPAVDRVLCLGDVVGYAADSADCVRRIRDLGCPCVMGNHDFYAAGGNPAFDRLLSDPDAGANPVLAGIRHARKVLSSDALEWLRRLPREHVFQEAGFIASHAALHDPEAWPYLLSPRDAAPTLEQLRSGFRLGFFGHTHRENVFSLPDDPQPTLIDPASSAPSGAGIRVSISPDACCAITIGSVGQPRGGDADAHWALWDSDSRELSFMRTPYDTRAAAQAIIDAGLPDSSAMRLFGVS